MACAQLLLSVTNTRHDLQGVARAHRSIRDGLDDVLLQLASLYDTVSLWQHDCTEHYKTFDVLGSDNPASKILARVPRILEHCAELMGDTRAAAASIADGDLSPLDQHDIDNISKMLDTYVISLRAVLEAYNL